MNGYLSGAYGFLGDAQYTLLFLLSFNPVIMLRLFGVRHWLFLSIGIILSFFNHRAVLPFILLILLDLNYDRLDDLSRKQAFIYALSMLGFVSVFGSSSL